MSQTPEQKRIESLESTIKLMTHACRVVFADPETSRTSRKIMAEAIDRGDAVLKEKA